VILFFCRKGCASFEIVRSCVRESREWAIEWESFVLSDGLWVSRKVRVVILYSRIVGMSIKMPWVRAAGARVVGGDGASGDRRAARASFDRTWGLLNRT